MNTELLGYELLNANPDVLMRYMHDLLDLDKNISPVCWSEENFMVEIPGKWELSYLVISRNKVIAFVISSIKEEPYHVHRLGVDPFFQRQGLGSGLLDLIYNQAMKNSIHAITLKVAKTNDNALKFYKLKGFKIIRSSGSDYLLKKEVDQ